MKTTLRILFAVCISLPVLQSCRKKIDVPNEDFNLLFGKWNRISETGGSPWNFEPDDDSEVHIEYKENGIHKKSIDGKNSAKKRFSFEKETSIYSGNIEYVIAYTLGKKSKKGAVSDSFEFLGSDTLVLRNECNDCFTSTYVREY